MIWKDLQGVFAEAEHKFDSSLSAWEEEPVDFKTFNESPDYLASFPLSERQYADVMNVIGTDPKEVFSPSRQHELGVFVWGKGSGKDLVISRLFAYFVYVLLCMKDPQQFLWMTDSTTHIDLLNVARKGGQAREIFFSYFSKTIKKGPWFRNHFIIRESNKIQSKPLKPRGTIDIGGSKIEFPKNIKAYAETSAFEGYEGFNIVAWVADEISAFKSVAEQENAYGIFKTLRTSGSSRHTKYFKHLGFLISYPRQLENDIILDKYYESFTNDSIYGSFGWQWQIKPAHLYSGKTFLFKHERIGRMFLGDDEALVGVEIPVELQQDFIDDPADAMAKHLCAPSTTSDQWAEYPELFYNAYKDEEKDIVVYEDYVDDIYNAETGMYEKRIKKRFIKIDLPPRLAKDTRFVLWLDAAETMCDAVVAIGHEEKINGVDYVIQDANLIWRPDVSRNLKISLKNVEEWVTDILPTHLNIVAIGSDYWNSSGMAESLRFKHPNIRTIQANLSGDDYNLAKKYVYTNQVVFRFLSVVQQLTRLKNSATGVPRPPLNGRKDQADGAVGIIKLLKSADARKYMGFTQAPATSNLPEVHTGAKSNIFSPTDGPFSHSQESPFTPRMVASDDFRKYLGVSHKPWKSASAKQGDEASNHRLPLSTSF